jgi:hypothetical protein
MSASEYEAPDLNTTAPGAKKGFKIPDDGFDYGWDDMFETDDEKTVTFKMVLREVRTAFLIRVLESGFPGKEKGLLYYLMIQFVEELHRPLYVYSALPALLMWYYPIIHPRLVYAVTRGIDTYHRIEFMSRKEAAILVISHGLSSFLFQALIDFRGVEEIVKPLFGPIERWPAALFPIVPGMSFRVIDERPNSINGFVPENKQGIVMAVFIRACTAVLPKVVQWGLWAGYASPSSEYPVMFIDFLVCTVSWMCLDVTPMAGYVMWLLVNQYRHPETWFRASGGGPSVILQRERRGTLWFIETLIFMKMLELGWGEIVVEQDFLTLTPQIWIPIALILVIGLYLLKYGVMLRIYRYKHEPLGTRKSFRLLRLRAQPCLPNLPVQCDMIHTSLYQPPQYTAISHRWEPAGATQEMILIDGGLFSVSRTIHSLLMANRSNLHPRYFWIDSICINQDDRLEKTKQVGMMRNIFEEAESTLGWLGDASDAKKVLNLVRRVNETTTAASFSKLWSDLDAGWSELDRLLSNEWFERIWIIQELAVAKVVVLRYGDEYFGWKQLLEALARIMLFSPDLDRGLKARLDQGGILNALIMEEFRYHIENVDLIKLKDTLKLTLGFKSTLPVDKIYALLGLVDERHTPLFHPRFGASDINGINRVVDPRTAFKDAAETMGLLTEILGNATGRSNSRRAKAIMSAGPMAVVRYTALLTRDLKNISEKLKNLENDFSDLEVDRMQPDYSEASTAKLVYTYVARDLLKQGDALSFIRHAGIGFARDQELLNLPTWVPDWSQVISVYLLPWRKLNVASEKEPKDLKEQVLVFKDGGSRFLLVQGCIVGRIVHTATLTNDYDTTRCGTWEEVEQDFNHLSSNFRAALDLAHEHVGPHFHTAHELKEAFYSTLIAQTTAHNHLTVSKMRDWTLGLSSDCPIAAELLLKRIDLNNNISPESTREISDLNGAFTRYSFIRRASSSVNCKLAHLIQEDVIPSFSQYRMRGKTAKDEPKSSLLNKDNHGILSGYAQYVDYTIGRSFIITDSRKMGLSPSASMEGDIVIKVKSDGRIVWFTLREDVQELEQDTKPLEGHDRQVSHETTYQLVGEAYIYETTSEAELNDEFQWFKLS